MDKNAIKKYAVWARRELISRVSGRAAWYGITEDNCVDADADSIDGRVLSTAEKKQRAAFIFKVMHEGYEQAIEEVAYTWFNRFCALRYMEVNGYLPSHIRVFTDDTNEFKPQILDEAIHMEMKGLDTEKVLTYKDINDTEGLYRYLLITQCNALSAILPGMFQKIEDYTELLLPENLLRDGSVIERMIAEIPEEDWTDQVQIIGWLYQYYNAEKKDEVFAALKKNVKITKENIPAATQLFTPDWIVRYMVENSLGRLWMEGHPNDDLKLNWKYYLDEAEQEPEVEVQLVEIRKEHAFLNPEDIKVIDPCMGSGHILVYAFDILMQIYETQGYTKQDAVKNILENNLYGLDIDERAAQLAYFSIMMKARSYDRHFFGRNVFPHIYAVQESNCLNKKWLSVHEQMQPLFNSMQDAEEYGSIIKTPELDYSSIRDSIRNYIQTIGQVDFDVEELQRQVPELLSLIDIAEILSRQYSVVVTNPPYMGSSNMSEGLGNFIKKYYPDSKNDLFAVFIERCEQMTKKNSYQAMITQQAWMFFSSYEKLRRKIIKKNIVNMVHLGAHAFEEIGGEVVQTTSFVLRNSQIFNYIGTYCRLIDQMTQQGKESAFFDGLNRYYAKQENFFTIPGSPVAYWLTDKILITFKEKRLGSILTTREGMATANNDLFLRHWHEVLFESIGFHCHSQEEANKSGKKWFPYDKGGDYRKWYGNNDFVVNWFNEGYDIRNNKDMKTGRIRSHNYNGEYAFRSGITWSSISSGDISVRFSPEGFLFDSKGAKGFTSNMENLYTIQALINSKVARAYLKIFSPTLDFKVGDVILIPLLQSVLHTSQITNKALNCVQISKEDWDSFEASWDFQSHALVRWSKELLNTSSNAETMNFYYGDITQVPSPLELCWLLWQEECNKRFEDLKSNEEELNRILIEIYGLQDELSPEVEDKDITVRKANLQRDVKSLISYAVGCMFGRYSLDVDGLAYAGGEWDATKYETYQPDYDGILPICDDEYFTDDIVGHFVDFIRTVYGSDTLEENLQFIADALGGTGTSREIIRKYFLNDFFADHCKIYQKRPIYWLFDSGKKNGFKCLIYLHRYRPDTIARIRTDYVHEQQARYRTNIADLENRIETASTSDRIKLNKELKKAQEQADELHDYEEKIHHLADQFIDIDLDEGVKVNYAKFQDVLAKIK